MSPGDKRPTWDQHFMNLAYVVAEMSTCDRANVGCVLVRDKQVLSVGFNGSPRRVDHCSQVGHLMRNGHCCRSTHSEINAIIQAAQHGVSTNDSYCYVTHYPCLDCTKALINAGIVRVIYDNDYRVDPVAQDFFRQALVLVEKLDTNQDV